MNFEDPVVRPYRPSHFEAWERTAGGDFKIRNCIQVVHDISDDMTR